jgi:hypothetical protein
MQKHCFYNWRFSLGSYMEMPNVKIYDEMAENVTCIWVLKHENCFIDACRIQEKNKFFA